MIIKRYKYLIIHVLIFVVLPFIGAYTHAVTADYTYKKNLSLFTPDNCWNRGSYQEHNETKYLYECTDSNYNNTSNYTEKY